MTIGENVLKIEVKDGRLNISISVDDLAFVANNHPDGYEVVDKDKLADKVAWSLINDECTETGLTPLQRVIDDIFNHLVENAEDDTILSKDLSNDY